jgi:aldehyde dehydrogenase (NAD+)
LIVPANTPIANIAWKIFPALICGNCVVLKASELAPQVANEIATCVDKAGFPPGVFNIIQGGRDAGSALVGHPDVPLISFTGSTHVGKEIAKVAGSLLKRVSLELGGKNCLVVADDADLEQAVKWSVLSAFSNAGQRCSSASRILVFGAVYDDFRRRFLDATRLLKLGVGPGCDLGPLMTKTQRENALALLKEGIKDGGVVLEGETREGKGKPKDGFYFLPTIVEGVPETSKLQTDEAFAPLVCLTKVENLDDALRIVNSSKYGLTCSIHTTNVAASVYFARRAKVGVVNVNTGTYGSEPHMPFGGFRESGNGTREPGSEALDVYSELTNVSMIEG